MIEKIILLSVVLNIVALIAITYFAGKIRELEKMMYSIPDPYAVFDEKMKTKIPMIVGADGKPVPLSMSGEKTPSPSYVG